MGQVGGGEVGCVTREADTAEDAQASGLECCVRADWRLLQYVDESVRADPKVVLAAVEIDWRAYELGAEALKADRAFLLAAMQRDVRVYTVALPELMADPVCALAAVKLSGEMLSHVPIALHRPPSPDGYPTKHFTEIH